MLWDFYIYLFRIHSIVPRSFSTISAGLFNTILGLPVIFFVNNFVCLSHILPIMSSGISCIKRVRVLFGCLCQRLSAFLLLNCYHRNPSEILLSGHQLNLNIRPLINNMHRTPSAKHGISDCTANNLTIATIQPFGPRASDHTFAQPHHSVVYLSSIEKLVTGLIAVDQTVRSHCTAVRMCLLSSSVEPLVRVLILSVSGVWL